VPLTCASKCYHPLTRPTFIILNVVSYENTMYFGLQGGKKQEIKNINYEVIKCSNTDTTDATSHKHNLGYEE